MSHSQWIDDYVGIPFEIGGRSLRGLDCYGLVWKVYRDILGVSLPDWVTEEDIDWDGARGSWVSLDRPIDFCLLRSARTGGIPDHFGLYISRGVLTAGRGGSMFITLDNYLSKHPRTTFGVYKLAEDVH